MQSPIDWKKCVLCQEDTGEPLQCPARSKRSDLGAEYKTLASNLKQFVELGSLPLPVSLDALDEGNGVENALLHHNACWHKSCGSKFNVTKLKRAQKRQANTSESIGNIPPKRTRKSLQCIASKSTCFFCEEQGSKEPLHSGCTFSLDSRVRQIAMELQDEKLLAKLSAGDMVAQEAKYHKSCLTTLSNQARSTASKEAKVKNDKRLAHGIVPAELISCIEESRAESKGVLVFKMKKLSEMYSSRLKQLGIVEGGTLHSTRLKNRILASIPSLRAYTQGRDTLLAFDSDIGAALQQVCEEDKDTDTNYLAKAATIVRKEILAFKSCFKRTFERKCQGDSVPPSLVSLVKMVLYEPNIVSQLENSSSQAALTIAQLLQFNCYSRRRETSSNYDRHSTDRETPLPLYVGLSVHAQTRNRELVDTLFKLGIFISHVRVLSISTEIGNSVCRRFKEDGVLCPIKLRKGLFTTSAIDNIDHNPSLNTAQGLFMELAFPCFKTYLMVIQDVSERH